MASATRSALLGVVAACAVGVLVRATPAQGPAEAVSGGPPSTATVSPPAIASPLPDAFLSGPTKLSASLDPGLAVRNVTFFVDGRQFCSLSEPPFECEWDAGSTISAH